ncbi:MAG: hypothetical protein ABFD06_13180, partial [Smithella sp.]
ARFDEGGLATPIRCGYLGTVRRKGRKQISQPKEVIASSLLYPYFPMGKSITHLSKNINHLCKIKSNY